jgi:tetratricopeptide (TPR) repeat protein
MNGKLFIWSLLAICFVVSFASPCTSEDTKIALTIKNIAFNRAKGGIEKIALFCDQSCTPELFSLEGENPRVVMDMKGVLLIRTKTRNINTGGKLVKRIRSNLDKKTKTLRVVLDLEPSKSYIIRPMPDSSGNYLLTIKEDKDSPQSQEKRITILHPALSPEEQQESKPQEAASSPENQSTVKTADAVQSFDQGRSQLNNGDFAEAVDTFTKILSAHPQDSLIYRSRGDAYDNMGDREKALEDWVQAARLGDTTIQSFLDYLEVKWREKSIP